MNVAGARDAIYLRQNARCLPNLALPNLSLLTHACQQLSLWFGVSVSGIQLAVTRNTEGQADAVDYIQTFAVAP